jgi:alcohol dehydrogenase
MRAIYFSQFAGSVGIKELPIPKAPAQGVVIKVEATGLCRSDWHGWMGHDSDIALPHVPGHELAGMISAVGTGVSQFKVGDRVTVPFVNGCGLCEFCKRGDAQVCPQQTQPGFTQWGSFAEYVAIESADFNLIALPSDVSYSTAAALGCRFATAFRGLHDRVAIKPGEKVAIFGCGGVGLSAIMIAKALGAHVIAVDINTHALEKALSIGADVVINSKEMDVAKVLQSEGGVDVSVDALGSQATASAAVLSLKRLGRHLQLGLLLTSDGHTPMPMARVIGWELEIIGSHGMAAADYPAMLAMVASGKLKPEILVERKITIEEGAKALSAMADSLQAGITIITPHVY